MTTEIYKPQFHKVITEWVSLLWQHLGEVVLLSALGFFGSIPLITGGIIFVGTYNIMRLVVARELALKEDFTSAVKEKWKTATALFLVNLLIILILAFDLYFFWNSPDLKFLFWVGIWFVIIFLMGLVYMFPMLATENVGFKKIFIRSFKMAMVDPLFSFLVAGFSILWLGLCVVLIPMLATLALGGLALWCSLAYREMSIKVDSILAAKPESAGNKNIEEE